MKELAKSTGCNPNLKPARIFMTEGELPIGTTRRQAGVISTSVTHFNSWQLVRALKRRPACPQLRPSHISPAGAALGKPLTDIEKQMHFVDTDKELSPIACAYIRATRGADRLCSYGDWAALSDTCDADTATTSRTRFSDGIIAPDFTAEALEILKTKRKGGYNVVKIGPKLRAKADQAARHFRHPL